MELDALSALAMLLAVVLMRMDCIHARACNIKYVT